MSLTEWPAELATWLATERSRGFHVSLTGLALVGGLLVGALWASSGHNPAYEVWLASAEQEIAATKAWARRELVSRAVAVAARQRAAELAGQVRALTASLDTAEALALAAATTGAESTAVTTVGAACRVVVQNCEERVAYWARADTVDAARADTNARGWARADSVVQAGVKAQECRVNLVLVHLGCPSRTATFFTGAGLVELLHVVFKR